MGDTQPLPKNFYAILKKVIGALFEKNFSFKTETNWVLPATGNFFSEDYSIDSLQALKSKLNAVKSKLNDVQIEDWSAHTRRRNPSGEVAWRLKTAIDAEFVTQAWCKFYECLNRFPIVQGPSLNSVHLCEAPGAFIAALNHYLHSNFLSVEWKWLATTLNPYHEGNPLSDMVIDDRFMLHTLENWIFGKDFTGNILNINNVDCIASQTACLGEINLITADGSIDCMEKPECQEEIVSSLHYAETCAAFRILSPGGCFILKVFTLFEATSASLLYLLNCTFDRVDVFKPATSKCGNSEVYIICLGFRKDDKNFPAVLTALMSNLESEQQRPLFGQRDIPPDFLEQLESCARFFMEHQIMVINRNIASYKNPGPGDVKRCKLIRVHVTNHYLNVYNVRRISNNDKILHSKPTTVQYYKNSRIYSGSFSERRSLRNKAAGEKLMCMLTDLELLEAQLSWPYEEISLTIEAKQHELHTYRGKPVNEICSSLFVNIHLMNFINKIVKIVPSEASMPIHVSMDSNDLEFKVNRISLHRDYHTTEKHVYRELLTAIGDTQPESVTIIGLPLLTHFAASFIAALSGIFGKITLDAKRTIKMQYIQLDQLNQKLNLIKALCEDEGNENEDVLCLIDIKQLHDEHFKEIIMNYNNQNCLQFCRIVIEKNTV